MMMTETSERKMILLLWTTVVLLANNLAVSKPTTKRQCMDDNDNPVDWYVLYKLPKISQSSEPLIRRGLAYLYITSDSVEKGWQLSTKDISQRNSTPGNTLAPIYNEQTANSTLWAFYNDNPPTGQANGRYGHAKGVVFTSKSAGGFWLIHSVPNFPSIPKGGESPKKRRNSKDAQQEAFIAEAPEAAAAVIAEGKYDYPTSGQSYGQSFLCISVAADQFDTVAKQLMYNQIIVYRKNIPDKLAEVYPVLRDAFNQVRIKESPYKSKAVVRSLQSVEFTSFAKSDKWQKDLYDDFVAPELRADLLAETWLNGRGRLPTDCNGARVYNIESVVLKAVDLRFKSSQDHSKWAVSLEEKSNSSWVCIGDLNRADTQYSRGGGTVCLNSSYLWNSFRSSVNDIEPCPKTVRTV